MQDLSGSYLEVTLKNKMECNGYPVTAPDSVSSSESKIMDKMLQRSEARAVLLKKKKVEKDAETTIAQHTEYFNSIFHSVRQEIKEKLMHSHEVDKALLSGYFDEIIKDLQKLQKLLSDSIMFMPAYEIKVAQESLKVLNEEIQEAQNALLPKKKFTFRNKKKIQNDPCPLPISIKQNGTLSVIVPNASIIDNLENTSIDKYGDDVNLKDTTLSLLKNCRVNILGAPNTLFISKLSNCQVFSGPVSTSIYIENCDNCTFVIACQQLRIHSSVLCDLYTHVTSRTIIEDSSSLQFAPYDWTYHGQEKDFLVSGLDKDRNNWNLVDDFNWLVSGVPSPNWSILPEEKRAIYT